MSTAHNCLLSSKKIQEKSKEKEGEKVTNRWKIKTLTLKFLSVNYSSLSPVWFNQGDRGNVVELQEVDDSVYSKLVKLATGKTTDS